jgi:hypothetical protein
MTTQYKIRHGFSFVDHLGAVLTGGRVVELADDVAQLHLHKLEVLPAPTSKRAPPKAQKVAAADTPAAEAAPELEAVGAEPEGAQGDLASDSGDGE